MNTLLIAGHGYLGQEVSRQAGGAGWQVTALSLSGDDFAIACDLSARSEVDKLRAQVPAPRTLIASASSGRGGPMPTARSSSMEPDTFSRPSRTPT